jgi:hypothetical protein
MSELQAFADESFREEDGGGFYVLAAAVLPTHRHVELRAEMLKLRGARPGKLHWHEMDQAEKGDVAKRVADFDEMQFVAVGTPVPARCQERGRALCMHRLVTELHAAGVERITAEARTVQLDGRDVRTVQQVRHSLPKGARFRIGHARGVDEPLLWVPDVVAGAVRAKLQGNGAFFEPLAGCVVELYVETRT